MREPAQWLWFDESLRTRLAALRDGDFVVVDGKIEKVTGHDIDLRHCEIGEIRPRKG
jgi:hypothetical protein